MTRIICCLLVFSSFSAIALPKPDSGSSSPNLTSWEHGVIASWWQKEEDGSTSFRVSVLTGKTWSSPTTVASGREMFTNWADIPTIGVAKKYWVASWLQKNGKETYAYEVRLAVSRDFGKTWKKVGRLHKDHSASEHGFVSFSNEGDQVRAYWLDGNKTLSGGPTELRTAIIDVDGPRDESVVDDRTCDCCWTSAVDKEGVSIVAFRDRSSEEIRDIKVQAIGADGSYKWSHVLPDNWNIKGCPVNGPAIGKQGNSVAVAWFTAAENKPKIRFALIDRGKEPRVLEINEDMPGVPVGRVRLIALEDRYMVSWVHTFPGGRTVLVGRNANSGELGHISEWEFSSSARRAGRPSISLVEDRLLIAATTVGSDKSTQVKFRYEDIKPRDNKPKRFSTRKNLALDSKFRDHNGKFVDISPDINGPRPSALVFWALWCKPCLEEIPLIIDFWQKEKPRANLMFVNLDENDASAKAHKWISSHKKTGTYLYNPAGTAYESYGISVLPTTIVLTNKEVFLNSQGDDPKKLIAKLRRKLL